MDKEQTDKKKHVAGGNDAVDAKMDKKQTGKKKHVHRGKAKVSKEETEKEKIHAEGWFEEQGNGKNSHFSVEDLLSDEEVVKALLVDAKLPKAKDKNDREAAEHRLGAMLSKAK